MAKIEGGKLTGLGLHNDETEIVLKHGDFLVTKPYSGGSTVEPFSIEWEVWYVEEDGPKPLAEFKDGQHAIQYVEMMSQMRSPSTHVSLSNYTNEKQWVKIGKLFGAAVTELLLKAGTATVEEVDFWSKATHLPEDERSDTRHWNIKLSLSPRAK